MSKSRPTKNRTLNHPRYSYRRRECPAMLATRVGSVGVPSGGQASKGSVRFGQQAFCNFITKIRRGIQEWPFSAGFGGVVVAGLVTIARFSIAGCGRKSGKYGRITRPKRLVSMLFRRDSGLEANTPPSRHLIRHSVLGLAEPERNQRRVMLISTAWSVMFGDWAR